MFEIKIELNEMTFYLGQHYTAKSVGLFINFEDEKIKDLIEYDPKKLLDSIHYLLTEKDLYLGMYMVDNFEYFYLQGWPWHQLTTSMTSDSLSDIKYKSELVLNSSESKESQKIKSQIILNALNGIYPEYIPIEKTPGEKSQRSFKKKRQKLKLKLIIQNGYQCDNCFSDKADSLCVVRKDNTVHNYELENIILRCRSCINKLKSKK